MSRHRDETVCRASFDVLMRRRQLDGTESLYRARARVDLARTEDELRAALLDESAICLRSMDRLPMPPKAERTR